VRLQVVGLVSFVPGMKMRKQGLAVRESRGTSVQTVCELPLLV